MASDTNRESPRNLYTLSLYLPPPKYEEEKGLKFKKHYFYIHAIIFYIHNKTALILIGTVIVK